jgi:polysaccharide pyruvyl transferase WcaK-like protein
MEPATIMTSNHSGISFYTTIALLSSFNKIPLMLYAVGIGPLFGDDAKRYVRAIADIASIITVRDKSSFEQLVSMGIFPEKITVTADPVFSYTPVIREENPVNMDSSRNPTLGIALRNWDVDVNPLEWECQLALGIDQFLDQHQNYSVIFIPFQHKNRKLLDDAKIAKRICRLMRNSNRTNLLKESTTFSERAETLAHCDLVLGMRLHALIIAAINKVPAVGLIYDPKIKNIMSQLKMEKYILSIDGLSSTELSDLLEDVYQNRSGITNQLQRKTGKLASEAIRNTVILKECINKNYALPSVTQPVYDTLAKNTILLSQIHYADSNLINDLRNKISRLEEENARSRQKEIELFDEIQRWGNEPNRYDSKDVKKGNQTNINNSTAEYFERVPESEMNEAANNQARKVLIEKIQTDKNNLSMLSSELELIKKSRGWKMLITLWKIRQVLVPRNSNREKFFKAIIGGGRNLINKAFLLVKQSFMPLIVKIRSRGSRYAYIYSRYKQQRQKIWSANLENLNVGFEAGLVSIILPVYNGEKYLHEAIESILNCGR